VGSSSGSILNFLGKWKPQDLDKGLVEYNKMLEKHGLPPLTAYLGTAAAKQYQDQTFSGKLLDSMSQELKDYDAKGVKMRQSKLNPQNVVNNAANANTPDKVEQLLKEMLDELQDLNNQKDGGILGVKQVLSYNDALAKLDAKLGGIGKTEDIIKNSGKLTTDQKDMANLMKDVSNLLNTKNISVADQTQLQTEQNKIMKNINSIIDRTPATVTTPVLGDIVDQLRNAQITVNGKQSGSNVFNLVMPQMVAQMDPSQLEKFFRGINDSSKQRIFSEINNQYVQNVQNNPTPGGPVATDLTKLQNFQDLRKTNEPLFNKITGINKP